MVDVLLGVVSDSNDTFDPAGCDEVRDGSQRCDFIGIALSLIGLFDADADRR